MAFDIQVSPIHNTPPRFQKTKKGWMGCCGWVFYKNFTLCLIKGKTFPRLRRGIQGVEVVIGKS